MVSGQDEFKSIPDCLTPTPSTNCSSLRGADQATVLGTVLVSRSHLVYSVAHTKYFTLKDNKEKVSEPAESGGFLSIYFSHTHRQTHSARGLSRNLTRAGCELVHGPWPPGFGESFQHLHSDRPAASEKWPQSLPARTFRRRENSALDLEHPPSSTAAGLSLEKGSRRSGCWEYLSGQRFFRVSMEEVIPRGCGGPTARGSCCSLPGRLDLKAGRQDYIMRKPEEP